MKLYILKISNINYMTVLIFFLSNASLIGVSIYLEENQIIFLQSASYLTLLLHSILAIFICYFYEKLFEIYDTGKTSQQSLVMQQKINSKFIYKVSTKKE